MKSSLLFQKAAERAEYFSQALLWYRQAVGQNEKFKKNFILFTKALVDCALSQRSQKHVHFIAVGKSAHIAQLMVSMLVSVGICARFVHPTEAFHGDFGIVKHRDKAFFISNNGKSSELLQILPGLLERNVQLFALTAQECSPLAQSVHHVLLLAPFREACPLAQAPLTSAVTCLALCQLLVAATMEYRNYPLENYARNHPGGAIGKRIFLKADSFLIQGKNLPVVSQQAPFQVVVSVFTRYSQGAVLVMEENQFLGLITEKDLRVAMEKQGPLVFECQAAHLMNKNPKTVLPGLLAIDVMGVFCSKDPPFNVLPVVDDKGRGYGLLRMLDFVGAGLTVPL
jgi:arabinose-5-phosphate isomerase